ncbi:E3 ubiquitin/ISG15 ligase TRIM25-like [Rana temporaria]|uniref:E3 ubiquitin/ISG15 ligase TRIM25-like n=1 Tax=Rana temporaria TaxID=8407 RepID=UPI001AAD07B9|nr:E3 ubiquitin/ISG15 ligase TRIM25-like [Rana temporaria]
MASADPRNDLECSICLNGAKDPVTLKCGHSFCRDCIGHVLDTQEESGGCPCPECREEFQERPELWRKIKLRNIVENVLSAQPDQEDFGVFCTYCIHTPVPAVKSCLHCKASLCEDHLKVHNKSPEHVLCDPTTSLENRKCSVHQKTLEYYCTEDCSPDGGHRVEILDEASEMKKKLIDVLQKLMTEREETEKRVYNLQECRRKIQGKADDETEKVTALFRDLRRRLEDLEKRVLSEISGQAERVCLPLSDMIQQLEIKKEELSRKMGDIEEMCNMKDPLTVLQESDTGDLCETEDGDEGRERHDRLLHDGGDLDVVGISHTLHTGLSDIMSEVNVQKCSDTHVSPPSTTMGKVHINAGPSRRRPQPSVTLHDLFYQVGGEYIGAVQPTSGVSGYRDILLDVGTSGYSLHISDDRKTASWLSPSLVPLNIYPLPATERFQCPQVMSSQSFSSGKHCWEVDVGGSEYWTVGMCYPSIDKKGNRSLIGCNKKSWGLGMFGCNQYTVIHNSNQTPIPGNFPINRVGVALYYEAGQISFYDLCNLVRHLYTFTTTFTEPLHAGIYVWRGCVKICRGNWM